MARKNNLHGAHRQRGAIAASAAFAMLAGLAAMALALDLGRLYFAKRDLQSMANLAALDAARVVGGCMGYVSPAEADTAVIAEAQASVLRNQGLPAWVVAGETGTNAGTKIESGGLRRFDPADNPQMRAAQVRLTRPVPARLLPFMAASSGNITVVAAAHSTPKATLHVGTEVATVNDSNAAILNLLFSQLLGTPISLSAVSYQQLLGVKIPIQPLLSELNIGTTEELNTPISAQSLLDALIPLLLNTITGATGELGAALNGVNLGGTVVPAEILGITDVLDTTTANAASVLTALGGISRVAAGQDALINLPLTLPGAIGGGSVDVSIVQPGLNKLLTPGGTDIAEDNFASNSQINLRVNAPISIPLPLGLGSVDANLQFYVQAAKATAVVNSINCADAADPVSTVNVSVENDLAHIGIGRISNIDSPNPVIEPIDIINAQVGLPDILGLPGIPLLSVELSTQIDAPVGTNGPAAGFPMDMEAGQPESFGTPAASSMVGGLVTQLGVSELQPEITLLPGVLPPIGLDLGGLTSAVTDLLMDAVLDSLLPALDAVLMPLLQGLGVTLGGGEVEVVSIEVAQPQLFTR